MIPRSVSAMGKMPCRYASSTIARFKERVTRWISIRPIPIRFGAPRPLYLFRPPKHIPRTTSAWYRSPDRGRSPAPGHCESRLRSLADAIRNGRAPESDLDLAIDTTLTLYAGYVSADEKGREVEAPRI